MTARVYTGTLVDTRREPVGAARRRGRPARPGPSTSASRGRSTRSRSTSRARTSRSTLRVEASADHASWRTVADDAPVFSRAVAGPRAPHADRAGRARDRALPPAHAPATTAQSPAVDAHGPDRVLDAPRARRGLEPPGRGRRRCRGAASAAIGWSVPPGLPVETLTIDADDPAFSRRVVLSSRQAPGASERVLADGVALSGAPARGGRSPGSGGRSRWRRRRTGGALLLEVHDGDSPPLRGLRVDRVGRRRRAWCSRPRSRPSRSTTATTSRGARSTTWRALQGRLAATRGRFEPATLGPEGRIAAPRAAPAARVGRAARGRRWTRRAGAWRVRSISRAGRPLRRDARAGRPRRGCARTSATCGWWTPRAGRSRTSSSPPRGSAPGARAEGIRANERVSRYRLRAPSASGSGPRCRSQAIALARAAEPFFDRPALVRVTSDDRRSRGLCERPARAPAIGRRVRRARPIRMAWNPPPARELEIEIDERRQRAARRSRAPRASCASRGSRSRPAPAPTACCSATPRRRRRATTSPACAREVLAYSAVAGPLGASRATRPSAAWRATS